MKTEAYVGAINRILAKGMDVTQTMGSALMFYSEDMVEQIDDMSDNAPEEEVIVFMRKALRQWREVCKEVGLGRFGKLLDELFAAQFTTLAYLTEEEA